MSSNSLTQALNRRLYKRFTFLSQQCVCAHVRACACMCVHTPYASKSSRKTKKKCLITGIGFIGASDPLCRLARNRIQVLWKSKKAFVTVEPTLQHKIKFIMVKNFT